MATETPEQKAAREERIRLHRQDRIDENAVSAALTLTKVESMAATIMAGFAANPETSGDPKVLARLSVDWANSLLGALYDEI